MKWSKDFEIISFGILIALSLVFGVFRTKFFEPQLPGDENFGSGFSGLYLMIIILGILTPVVIFLVVKSRKKNRQDQKIKQEGLSSN
ncbi:hypothetical protein [Candidatus Lokiarchaeum ossiferum]|uniref:hypothetical protein n=1 Tax=Candidatus Lokiarchaeum ossiferum TaxID=2951803 RepID=UPI00352FAC18